MAPLAGVSAAALQVGSIPSLSANAASFSTSRSVGMACSTHLGCSRLRNFAASQRSPSIRPSLFVIRAEDEGTGVADATKSSSEKSTRSSPDVGNDAGSFFSSAAKEVQQNVKNAGEAVKDKAGDLADQAQSAGQDFGIKADQAKNQVAGSTEETAERFKEEMSKLTDEARSTGETIGSRTSDASASGKSELQGIASNVKGMDSPVQSGLDEATVKSGVEDV